MIEGLRTRTREIARRTWTKLALRGRLDHAHAIRAPWSVDDVRQQVRFAETCRIIQQELGVRFRRLLEIGCGEGHQTEHLATITDELTAIDASPAALQRARQRVPSAELLAGELLEQPWARERGRFDLVIACDVLDQCSDVPGLLRAIDNLGGACVATWLASSTGRDCEWPVMAMPGAAQTRLRHGDTEVVVAWWTGATRRTSM